PASITGRSDRFRSISVYGVPAVRSSAAMASVACAPQRAFSLLAAQAGWAGLSLAGDEHALDVLVVRARPGG
ncbi:hypothetical protein, partial [Streptomyces sp. NPDC003514]